MQVEEQFRHAQKMVMTIGGNAELAIESETSIGVRSELLEINTANVRLPEIQNGETTDRMKDDVALNVADTSAG